MNILTKSLCFGILFHFAQLKAQAWQQMGPTPFSARNHPVTFALGNYGYLLTGGSDQGVRFGDFYKYDPGKDQWTKLKDFPGGARSLAYGVTHNNKAYVGFGSSTTSYYNDLWEYNPDLDSWRRLANCPGEARNHPALIAAGGKICMGLGFGGVSNNDLNDWWVYDIAKDSWSSQLFFPGSRRHHPYYFEIGDLAYVGFGHHRVTIFNDFYRFDVKDNSWTRLKDFPGEGRVAGTQFSYLNRGYILSGQGEDHRNLNTGEFWQYNPFSDAWNQMPAHPGTGRWAPGSFIANKRLYLLAGRLTDDQNDNWSFNIDSMAQISLSTNPFLHESNSIKVTYLPEKSLVLFKSNIALSSRPELYNSQGRLVKSLDAQVGEINVKGLSKGMYILKVNSIHSQVFTRKVLVW